MDEPIEVINWKVEASGPMPVEDGEYRSGDISSSGPLQRGNRPVYFSEEGGFFECPVYDRYRLKPDTFFSGPALFEERESTCVIGVGDRVKVDSRFNLIAEIEEPDDT